MTQTSADRCMTDPPDRLPGEVFGFWHHGVWQPVLAGMAVTARPDGVVRFTYPRPPWVDAALLRETI